MRHTPAVLHTFPKHNNQIGTMLALLLMTALLVWLGIGLSTSNEAQEADKPLDKLGRFKPVILSLYTLVLAGLLTALIYDSTR